MIIGEVIIGLIALVFGVILVSVVCTAPSYLWGRKKGANGQATFTALTETPRKRWASFFIFGLITVVALGMSSRHGMSGNHLLARTIFLIFAVLTHYVAHAIGMASGMKRWDSYVQQHDSRYEAEKLRRDPGYHNR